MVRIDKGSYLHGPRGSGRTTRGVRQAAWFSAVFIVSSNRMGDWVKNFIEGDVETVSMFNLERLRGRDVFVVWDHHALETLDIMRGGSQKDHILAEMATLNDVTWEDIGEETD